MNPIAKVQKWMDSPSGQVFMNYAYSWGAAIVILGTLFKLTHIPGANTMLFIGAEFSPAETGQTGRIMTMEDLEVMARQVVFTPEKAPIRKADGELTIAQKDKLQTLTAGKKAVFTCNFANGPAVKNSRMPASTSFPSFFLRTANTAAPAMPLAYTSR